MPVHLLPFLKGADGQSIPSWGFVSKTVQFQGKLFTAIVMQATVAGPILGIAFLGKFKITVALETSQILFACTATALPATKPFLPSFAQISEPPFSVSPATEPTPKCTLFLTLCLQT
jgi:hypothetical protein